MPDASINETTDPNALRDPNVLRTAQGYYELGMISDCKSAFRELPEEAHTRPDGMELSILLALDAEDFSKALEMCDLAVETYPNAPFGYVNKAFALHETQRTEESLELLEEAHLIVAIEPVAIYNRGCYLACLNRTTEALFWVSRAIRMDPQLRTHAESDPDLQDIFHRLEPHI